jgi:CO dehydrogenase/acetyl-CoA synthase delta subunit
MPPNRNETIISPDPSATHPGFGILSEVPKHVSDACCHLPPAEPNAQALSARKTFLDQSLLGETSSAVGPVPRLNTRLTQRDRWGGLKVRLGLKRHQYAVDPGLYAVGQPDRQAPVLVTANYKLSLDALRSELTGLDAWILVLDTKGVNVWCAAGKGTFATDELVHWLTATRLDQVVAHRRLVLPQLGASGVAGHAIRQRTGFRVIWGPVRASDLKAFLKNPKNPAPAMRRISFTLRERMILIPMEISAALKPGAWATAAVLIIALVVGMLGPGRLPAVFGFMLLGVAAGGIGVIGGAVLAPILLPWLPGKAFAVKGATIGLVAAGLGHLILYPPMVAGLSIALALMTMATSSFLAMNFTGATPFTSPSGVEKEMRLALPAQIMTMGIGTIGWLVAIWAG